MDAKKELVIETLKESFGNISKACKAVGISRGTFYNWQEADAEFKEATENISEYVIDEVENALFDQIKNGATAATIFYLKTKGKHRGYVEKTEIDQKTEMSGSLETKTTIKFTRGSK